MDLLLIARSAQTTAAVVLAGTLLLRLCARETAAQERLRWPVLARICWGALVVASGAVLVLTAADMAGQTVAEALRVDVIGNVLGTTLFGTVWLVRTGTLAGLLVLGAVSAQFRRLGRPVPGALDAANLLLAATVLTTLIWAGHTQASARGAWLLAAGGLHVLAAGAWPGGLVPLVCLLLATRRDPSLLPSTTLVCRRFSRASVVAVAVLGASGWLNAYGIVGTVDALWPNALWMSHYGRLLLCKVVLFAGMVGLGASNHRLIRPSPDFPRVNLRRLGWNVALECALAAAVLLATEALALSPPPNI